MRTIMIAIACLAAGTAGGAPDGHAAGTKPTVLLVGRAPVAVSGWRFVPGERVVVTLVRATPSKRRVVVDRNGRFFALFPGLRIERCSSVVVTVLSQRGTTKLPAGRPNCKSD